MPRSLDALVRRLLADDSPRNLDLLRVSLLRVNPTWKIELCATGEEAPWYLKPYLTFPAIFLGVALSFYGLLQTDVIVLRGDNSPIPGQQGFTLSD